MFTSSVIFESLRCWECSKYLSVKPIKVYPDRKVKCGRCARDNDGGSVSYLYETVAENIQFPCINNFEGCRELFTIDTVKHHEKSCIEDKYTCILCNFNDNAYNLRLHIIKMHPDKNLCNTEFFVDMDQTDKELTYFYSNKSPLLHIFCKFDASNCQLFLNICCLNTTVQKDTTYSIQLRYLDNTVIYKSSKIPLTSWDLFRENGFIYDITERDYSKNVIVCTFELNESALLTIPKHLSKSADNHSSLPVTFGNIKTLENICYSSSYVINGIQWRLYLRRVFKRHFLSANLVKEDGRPCCIAIVLTLLPNDENKGKSINFKRTFYDLKQTSDKTIGFLKWKAIVVSDAYTVQDSLTFVLHIGIHNTDTELEQCKVCKVFLNSVIDINSML